MSVIADLISEMADAGASIEVIRIAVRAVEEFQMKEDARRSKRAEQKRKERAATVARLSRDSAATVADAVSEPSRECIIHARADGNLTVSSLRSETELVTPSPSDCPPTTARSARCERFDEFYRVYPKHVGRKAAMAKYAAAVRSGVDPQRIIDAATRFADATRRAQTEPQFIAHPATWLSQGRFDDEDLPMPFARAGPQEKQRGGAAHNLAILLEKERRNDRTEAQIGFETSGELPVVSGERSDDGGRCRSLVLGAIRRF